MVVVVVMMMVMMTGKTGHKRGSTSAVLWTDPRIGQRYIYITYTTTASVVRQRCPEATAPTTPGVLHTCSHATLHLRLPLSVAETEVYGQRRTAFTLYRRAICRRHSAENQHLTDKKSSTWSAIAGQRAAGVWT